MSQQHFIGCMAIVFSLLGHTISRADVVVYKISCGHNAFEARVSMISGLSLSGTFRRYRYARRFTITAD